MGPEAVGVSLDLDDDGVVEQAIEESGGDDVVTEDLAPLLEGAVGGEDHGAALVSGVDQLEEEVGAALRERQVTDLVDDQERVSGEETDAGLEAAFALGLLE